MADTIGCFAIKRLNPNKNFFKKRWLLNLHCKDPWGEPFLKKPICLGGIKGRDKKKIAEAQRVLYYTKNFTIETKKKILVPDKSCYTYK